MTHYRPQPILALLNRGEYRVMPNGLFLACCWECGDLVETAGLDPIAAHDCKPTPDPEEKR
jgi:hypothetical protein